MNPYDMFQFFQLVLFFALKHPHPSPPGHSLRDPIFAPFRPTGLSGRHPKTTVALARRVSLNG